MKLTTFVTIILFTLLFLPIKANKRIERKIIGKWYNPYTYQASGELKGFHFKKNGKCEAINIPSLDLRTWKIVDGQIIIDGYDITEDGRKSVYKTSERVEYISGDSLSLVSTEKPFKISFLYMTKRAIKKGNPSKTK